MAIFVPNIGSKTRAQLEGIENAVVGFAERATATENSREAADWALAAKNMASALHSLMGAIGAAGSWS